LDSILPHLWGEEQGERWARTYQLLAETERTQNGISMSHQIRHWFDDARFALKPLRRPDDSSIVVQWHWLEATALRPRDRTSRFDSTASILESAGLADKSWGACLARGESRVPIRTGQVFTIRAQDPADLPSWDLLELSWNLLRVAAICGAANADDAYWDAPDDDDEEWPEHAVLAAMRHNLKAMQENLAARQQAYAARDVLGPETVAWDPVHPGIASGTRDIGPGGTVRA